MVGGAKRMLVLKGWKTIKVNFKKIALKHDHFLKFIASQEKRIDKTL